MTLDTRKLGEDLLGAEIVAGKELTEAAGSVFDALEKGGAIWRQQAQWLAEDYMACWMSAVSSPTDTSNLMKFVERRSEHIASGLQDIGHLIENEVVPLSKIWTDFLDIVIQDWRQA